MHVDPDTEEQLLLFDLGTPSRSCPSPDELAAALKRGAEIAISKHHRGQYSADGFNGMVQEVVVQALPRMKHFRHGGSKKLHEYAYMSCYFALIDIQRTIISRLEASKQTPKFYPLWERAS